jgi:hypothetical protein
VFAAAGPTTCAFSNNAAGAAQTATGSVDATKKILTFTMVTALAKERAWELQGLNTHALPHSAANTHIPSS